MRGIARTARRFLQRVQPLTLGLVVVLIGMTLVLLDACAGGNPREFSPRKDGLRR